MNLKNHKVIIFDYGCVISKPQSPESIGKIVKKLGLRDSGHFRQVYSLYRKEIDSGRIPLNEYWQKTLKEINLALPPEDLTWLVKEDIVSWADINEDTIELIRELKSNGKILAILSNMVIETLDYLRKNTSFIELFDHEFFSCNINMIKPDPEIYKHIIREMKVTSGDCIFVDDIPANCEAAEQQGIRSLLFKDVAQLRAELKSLLNS